VPSGGTATVTNTGTTGSAVLDFVLVDGPTGPTGAQGDAATITVGSVTSVAYGGTAAVTNSGTSGSAVLDFVLVTGPQGDLAGLSANAPLAYANNTFDLNVGDGLATSGTVLVADFSDATPAALGTAAAGTAVELARGDHVHPTDGLVLNSLLTNKAALITATAASTPVTLTVGTNGHRLEAASGESTGLKWAPDPVVLAVAVSDETTAITTGTAKVTFRMPFAMTVTAVRASLSTASSSGTPTFDINEGGSSILGTKLSIDANEKTSVTAASAATITDSALADDAEITIDIDTAGTGAKGAKVYMIGTRA
jgi:hypothetical protein